MAKKSKKDKKQEALVDKMMDAIDKKYNQAFFSIVKDLYKSYRDIDPIPGTEGTVAILIADINRWFEEAFDMEYHKKNKKPRDDMQKKIEALKTVEGIIEFFETEHELSAKKILDWIEDLLYPNACKALMLASPANLPHEQFYTLYALKEEELIGEETYNKFKKAINARFM